MGIINRWRERLTAARAALLPSSLLDPERMAFSAEIPGAGGQPLWKIDVQVMTAPQGDGERTRLRAHLQTNFASALRPALTAAARNERPAIRSDSNALTRSERVGQLAQRAATRALQIPLLRALAEPLLQHDFNTWIELQASSASLDQGARDLMPAREQLARMGIQPRAPESGDGPIADSWAGQAGGAFAQVSLLQLDKRHLPPRLARSLGDKPFQLAAAIVNVVEQKT